MDRNTRRENTGQHDGRHSRGLHSRPRGQVCFRAKRENTLLKEVGVHSTCEMGTPCPRKRHGQANTETSPGEATCSERDPSGQLRPPGGGETDGQARRLRVPRSPQCPPYPCRPPSSGPSPTAAGRSANPSLPSPPVPGPSTAATHPVQRGLAARAPSCSTRCRGRPGPRWPCPETKQEVSGLQPPGQLGRL